MVVARLAWAELTPDERAGILNLLKSHPHYDEYLKTQRPANYSQDEWVFLRAATWADWIKHGSPDRRNFSEPKAHYINLPFAPQNEVAASDPSAPNVVTKINASKQRATAGGDQVDRAVQITWLFHLLGDIHQPLHCITLFNSDFPNGDRGGTRAYVKNGGRVVQLHAFWDGLLGISKSRSSILGTVQEVQQMIGDEDLRKRLEADLKDHKSPDQWAQEGYELGKHFAYLDGTLRPASDDDPSDGEIPSVPADFAEEAGETARYCVAKGGKRLAQVIREVLAKN
jgi:hypothetical protein